MYASKARETYADILCLSSEPKRLLGLLGQRHRSRRLYCCHYLGLGQRSKRRSAVDMEADSLSQVLGQ